MARLLPIGDGDIADVRPKDEAVGFTLQELYALLDCSTIEVVHLSSTGEGREGDSTRMIVLIVDEEGLLKPNFVNEYATAMCREVNPTGYIVGPALLARVVNAGEDDERIE